MSDALIACTVIAERGLVQDDALPVLLAPQHANAHHGGAEHLAEDRYKLERNLGVRAGRHDVERLRIVVRVDGEDADAVAMLRRVLHRSVLVLGLVRLRRSASCRACPAR